MEDGAESIGPAPGSGDQSRLHPHLLPHYRSRLPPHHAQQAGQRQHRTEDLPNIWRLHPRSGKYLTSHITVIELYLIA